MTEYILRFISGKYRGGEFKLREDREIIIGRSSELDMVLVEDMVSRKHAKITAQGSEWYIQDLGSTNGTFVNGERIKRVKIKEGDRILVGTSILKMERKGAAKTGEGEAEQGLEGEGASSPRAGAAHKPPPSPTSGRIEEIPLPDMLQLFSTSKKTGVVHVTSEKHKGRIYLRRGAVIHADLEGLPDLAVKKALCRILVFTKGSFELKTEEKVQQFDIELEETTEALLGEAKRIAEEIAANRDAISSLEAVVALARPIRPALTELTREQLEVLQLAHNHGMIGAVLNKAKGDDAETIKILAFLAKKHYLRIKTTA